MKGINPKFKLDEPVMIDDIGEPLIATNRLPSMNISNIDKVLMYLTHEYIYGNLNTATVSAVTGILYYNIIDYPIRTYEEYNYLNSIINRLNNFRKLFMLQPFNIRVYPEYISREVIM